MNARGTPAFVSVVVPVRNGSATIGQTLDGLEAQTYDGKWEIVVVDNGSTDGTAENVRRRAVGTVPVRVVTAADHPGVAYARNVGWRAANGELVAYCDADDVPAPGWLSALTAAASSCDLAGGALDLDAINTAEVRSWHSGSGFPIDALPRPFGFLPYAPSCNVAVWKSVLELLGGWNEAYDLGGEDAELSWRAQLAGHELRFVPTAVVRFRLRGSLRGIARQAFRDGTTMPHLYADFARAGMPRRSLTTAALSWGWIVMAAPLAILPGIRRVAWLRRAAQHWGRLVGSRRYGVLFL